MKRLPFQHRHFHRPALRPATGSGAATPLSAVRVLRAIRLFLLTLAALGWLWFFGYPQLTAAGSGDVIRSDGRLDFISDEGRVLASIAIEIADTPQSRAVGLMGRTGLDDSVGMLFVHDAEGIKSFWMRNTPTPLDIVFVSASGRVVHIAANTQPMSDTVYTSQHPCRYVVEVLAGFCKRHSVKAGTQISWRRNSRPSP